jgi:nucleoside-diphosphate-sugar epimerase
MTTTPAPRPVADRVLIFGAGGFVGANLMGEFIRRGQAVTGVARDRAKNWRLARFLQAPIVETDITRTGSIERIIADVQPTTVINAASYGVAQNERDPSLMRAVNVTAVEHMLAAPGPQRFIHLGSCSEYGDIPGTVTEHTPLNPKDAYGAAKADASRCVLDSSANALVLRLFNIWGPLESPHRLLPSVIAHCRARAPLDLTAGAQRKDYMFAPDLARWIADIAMQAQTFPARVVNCASGTQITVKDLVLAVAAKLNGVAFMRFGAKPMPSGEVQSGPVDTKSLNGLLPGRAITPLTQAIDEMLASPAAPT